MSTYGFCPTCGAPGAQRERRPNGYDTCEAGHRYPSSQCVLVPREPTPPPPRKLGLTEFAELIDCMLVVTYYPNQEGRWSCSLKGAEVMSSGLLSSPQGSAVTVAGAMHNYAMQIAGKRIALHAGDRERRREYNVPAYLVGGPA